MPAFREAIGFFRISVSFRCGTSFEVCVFIICTTYRPVVVVPQQIDGNDDCRCKGKEEKNSLSVRFLQVEKISKVHRSGVKDYICGKKNGLSANLCLLLQKTMLYNMKLVLRFLRAYPLTILFLLVIWYLCFMDVPETPLQNVALIDKWTHCALYLVLGLLFSFEFLRTRPKASFLRLLLWIWLFPVCMGGLIELLQAYCTGGRRSGEWMDFVADAMGSTIAFLICTLWARRRAKA